MATNNKKAGGAWKETRHDKFYHLAKEQGYRSRAAFKLIQLNKKYDFLSNCKSIVDLGAAPGGWLQVAQKYMPVSSLIIGVDLLPIRPIRGVTTIQADITTEQCKKQIKQELQTWDVDVVLHDGAPNVAGGGSWTKDAYVQNELVIHSLRLATTVLRQGGWFITKIFRSQDYNSLLWVLQQFFKKVEVTKPAASRNASAEIFCVCQGYLAPKKIDAKLLDPNVIFQQFDDEVAKKKPDVFSAKQPKRVRSGYDDVNNMIQTKKLDILQFLDKNVDQSTAIRYLGDYNSFTFEEAPKHSKESLSKDLTIVAMSDAERQKHDSLLKIVLNHSATTDEIKELCSDLKVLGKGDFKSLLKYRKSIQVYLDELELEEKKKDGRYEAEEEARKIAEAERALQEELDKGPKLTEEQQFALELKQLKIKKAEDAKRERKKKREAKAKANKRSLVNLHNLKETGELTGGNEAAAGAAGTEGGLFSLKVIKSKEALDYVAETEGKGKSKKKAANGASTTASEDDVDMADGVSDSDEDDMDDDEGDDSDEGELYREILQEQEEEFQSSRVKGGKNRLNTPMNEFEDQEEQLLAKLRAREAKRTGDYTATKKIGLDNVRGDDDEQEYADRLERDLDFMYETYKERRDIKDKKKLETEIQFEDPSLLEQANKEEKAKLAKQKKRKREDDSDTDTEDDDDMDRFNSDESSSSSEDEEDEQEETTASASQLGSDDSDADDEENSNPLLRKLTREMKPSQQQRLGRWMKRGLLGEAFGDEEPPQEEDEDEEEEESRSSTSAQNGKKVNGKKGKARQLIEIDAGAGSSSDDESRGGSDIDGADDMSDVEDEENGGLAATFFKGGKAVRTKSGLKPNTVRGLDGLRTSTKAVQEDVVMEDEESDSKKKKNGKDSKKKKGKKEFAPKQPEYDADGDEVDVLKVAEKKARAAMKKTTKNYKAQEKARVDSDKEKSEAFEEVPALEDEEMAHFSSDDDAIAERLALGKQMLTKKTRNSLINDSYNRYSLDPEELAGLPEWFVRDEGQHHTPILPVTKAEVDTYKEQLRAINTRPIKKIAEAKARKQVKTQKRWEKIKAQAEVIANQEGGNGNEKLRQIEKLFHQKSLKKEKKERVYVVTQKNGKTITPKSSSGRKGKVVKVDTRMKKDKRGEKKAAQRSKKQKANKNKKQRKL